MRSYGRKPGQLRPMKLECGVLDYAEGSCIVTVGKTRVLCAASVETEVPRWLAGRDKGWITAEYNMLPRSNRTRSRREGRSGAVGGRTQEIQRLIGRSLRAVTDLEQMPGVQVVMDCDVIQADGGTRTASITGSFVALAYALRWARRQGLIAGMPLMDCVAAVSVGKVDGRLLIDLDYDEDSKAEVDANFVMTGRGNIVEVQGTAEGAPFTKNELMKMMDLAKTGIDKLIGQQMRAIRPKLDFAGRCE